jgi:hypothetical protein
MVDPLSVLLGGSDWIVSTGELDINARIQKESAQIQAPQIQIL